MEVVTMKSLEHESWDVFLNKFDIETDIILDEDFLKFLNVDNSIDTGMDKFLLLKRLEQIQLEFLNKRTMFFEYALENFKYLFVRMTGVGYRVIPANEQVQHSTDKCMNKLKNAIYQAERRVRNVRHSALTQEERAKALNALVHLQQLKHVLSTR